MSRPQKQQGPNFTEVPLIEERLERYRSSRANRLDVSQRLPPIFSTSE
jgi:hypothetical protein